MQSVNLISPRLLSDFDCAGVNDCEGFTAATQSRSSARKSTVLTLGVRCSFSTQCSQTNTAQTQSTKCRNERVELFDNLRRGIYREPKDIRPRDTFSFHHLSGLATPDEPHWSLRIGGREHFGAASHSHL